MRNVTMTALVISAVMAYAANAYAQAPAVPPLYGETINIDTAKKAAAAAAEEARKNNWAMCIAVVAPSGDLIYFERMDNCIFGSITVAQNKARAAAIYRRTTKTFEDRVASGGIGVAVLSLPGAIPSEGGIPIVVGGKVIGAIGCSGGLSTQDGQTCQAGVNAVK